MAIKTKRTGLIVMVILVILIIGALAAGPIMSQVEKPQYKVISQVDSIEVRDYKPTLVAEVSVEGERREAISTGFKQLADFIFGNNVGANDISMTAPVIQTKEKKVGDKIAMTAPVLQSLKEPHTDKNQWKVQFVMPSEYTAKTLPKPNNSAIRIIETEPTRYVVIRFSGRNTTENINEHETKLKSFMLDQNMKAVGEPIYAFYNPPMTLPQFRRNEVMIEIEAD